MNYKRVYELSDCTEYRQTLLARPPRIVRATVLLLVTLVAARAIQQSLKSALAAKTVILVAHRLSTIRQADVIYVMDAGQVAESGTHHQLIEQDGRYAALWRAQSEGEPIEARASVGEMNRRNNGHAYKGATKHAFQATV